MSKNILSGFTDIDKLIHEPARLAVMALLYVVDSADFTFIINQTGLTWGNLSAHLSKLEEAGYLARSGEWEREGYPPFNASRNAPRDSGGKRLRLCRITHASVGLWDCA